jgi:signal transduction histidine kinase
LGIAADDHPSEPFKRLCEMLEVLLCGLEVAVDARRGFVANASHGLRMALTLQRTLLEPVLAARHAGRQSLRVSCEELLAAGAEHERLFESLLTLASSERRLEHREPTDLRRLTESVLGAHRGEFERRLLTVSQALTPAAIRGDTGLIERLVANLMDNAVQHNIAGGHIEATTRTEGGEAILTVANSGDAVPADQLDGLLEPFHRLAPRRSADCSGHHGLGLSIVRAIAIAHDASLTVRRNEGGGLAVTIAFEAQAASQNRCAPSSPGADPRRRISAAIEPPMRSHVAEPRPPLPLRLRRSCSHEIIAPASLGSRTRAEAHSGLSRLPYPVVGGWGTDR